MNARWKLAHRAAWAGTYAKPGAAAVVIAAALLIAFLDLSVKLQFVGPFKLSYLLPLAVAAVRGGVYGVVIVGFPYTAVLIRFLSSKSQEEYRAIRVAAEGSGEQPAGAGFPMREVESSSTSQRGRRWLLRSIVVGVIGATLWYALVMKSYGRALPLGIETGALTLMTTSSSSAIEGAKEVRRALRSLGGWYENTVLSGVAGVLVGLGVGLRRRSSVAELAVASLVLSVLISTQNERFVPVTLSEGMAPLFFFFCLLGGSSTIAQLREAGASLWRGTGSAAEPSAKSWQPSGGRSSGSATPVVHEIEPSGPNNRFHETGATPVSEDEIETSS